MSVDLVPAVAPYATPGEVSGAAYGEAGEAGSRRWRALGTYGQLSVADPALADDAAALAAAVLAEVDAACSRFRADSDLMRANRAAGQWISVSPVLVAAVRVALRAAHATGGLVDPTLGEFMVAGGYDRTFAQLIPSAAADALPQPAGDAWADVLVAPSRLRVPAGVALDLGATGKAFAADLVAMTIVERLRVATVVSVGGDVRAHAPGHAGAATDPAAATPDVAPQWPVAVAPDLRSLAAGTPGVCRVLLSAGGLATSSITARRWVRAGSTWHHVLDPRTGRPAQTPWLAVTAYGACAADANTATTAALVLGREAPGWLAEHDVAARLIAADGTVHRTPSWSDHIEELPA